jgi:hypothetical protein
VTYADVCWRMLTYADVCWRMLTYADVTTWVTCAYYMCPHTTISVDVDTDIVVWGVRLRLQLLIYVSSYYYMCVLILLYVCPHTSDINVRILPQVLHRALKRPNIDTHVCWRMLTYADVCWRMLTYADVISILPSLVSILRSLCRCCIETLKARYSGLKARISILSSLVAPRKRLSLLILTEP